MSIADAQVGQEYFVKEIKTEDKELNSFLFTLGCYSGEMIRLKSKKKNSCIIEIKNGKYNIDRQLAEAIMI